MSGGVAVTWRSVATDLGATVTRSKRPLTVMIGAGASLSSGAPTTGQVAAAFEAATRGRFGVDHSVQRLLHLIPEPEKQEVLQPLFERVTPYIGYRCLAALARHRKVQVLNLNWDSAVEQACEELGVRYVSFDLNDRAGRKEIKKLPKHSGLAVAHVHGRLGEECRFETLKTLKFDAEQARFIAGQFLANTLVVVGASIVHDTDVLELLTRPARAGGLSRNEPSQWFFGRPEGSPQLEAIRRSSIRSGVLNYCCIDDVDFDELMVRILGSVLNADWDRIRNYQPSIGLPTFDELVWPEPAVLRPLLAQRMVALLGQPRLGKSVTAHFLAYLQGLWYAQEPWSRHDLPVRAVDGPADAVAALAGILADERRYYIVENPFGSSASTEENRAFIDVLQRVESMPIGSTVIIASRLSSWPAVSGATPLPKSLVGSSSSVRGWYSANRLSGFVRRIAPHRLDLVDRITSDELQTPAHVKDALLGLVKGDSDYEGTEIADKYHLLTDQPNLAWFCCVLRLQEFCAEMLPTEELESWLGTPVAGVPYSTAVSHLFQFDGSDRHRLAHDTDREATDRYIEANMVSISDRIKSGPNQGRPLVEAFRIWRVLAAAEAKDWATIRQSPKATLRHCAPALLSEIGGDARTLELLKDLDYDAWDLKDLSYEIVRLWHKIGELPLGRRLLDRTLRDRNSFGAYAVLEACLYMRLAVPDELWWRVYTTFDDLLDDAGAKHELALAVDALTWRPPPDRYGTPSWAAKFLKSAARSDAHWALVRFLAGYHGGGLSLLAMDDLVREDSTRSWSAEQAEFAAWLVRWHFIHQSRARAQFSRQPWVDKDFLCRALHPAPKHEARSAANRLLQSFLEFPDQAGWSFFLACNFAAIGQSVDSEGKALAKRAIGTAASCSIGIVAATLTYQTATEYAADLQRYFGADENRDALLDAMRDGLTLDGTHLYPPRFVVNREPVLCHLDVGLRWGNLRQALPVEGQLTSNGRFDHSRLLQNLRKAAGGLPAGQHDFAQRVIAQVEAGDFRMLDAAAAARTPGNSSSSGPPRSGDAYFQLLNRAASLMASQQPDLFA